MLQKYWISDVLDADAGEQVLESCLLRQLYAGGVYELLMLMIEDIPSVRERNLLLRNLFSEFRAVQMRHLGIDAKFRLVRTTTPSTHLSLLPCHAHALGS